MKKIIFSAFIISGLFFLNSCGNKQDNTIKTTSTNTTNEILKENPEIISRKIPATIDNTININNHTFSPETLTIKKDTTVTWINNDSVPHIINSTNFNSEKLNNSQSFSYTFTETGTFDYYCSFHPGMKAKITVE